ncbi:MAG: hypothetical protein K8U57_07240, partial [Planctomycetes bacterium]|nr:hypothetical protein [Planctomycetota bacterium]
MFSRWFAEMRINLKDCKGLTHLHLQKTKVSDGSGSAIAIDRPSPLLTCCLASNRLFSMLSPG